MSDTEAAKTDVLADLIEEVETALSKAVRPTSASALGRLRDFLVAVQANEELTTPGEVAAALKDAPRSPGFASYGPEITRALRGVVSTLEKEAASDA